MEGLANSAYSSIFVPERVRGTGAFPKDSPLHHKQSPSQLEGASSSRQRVRLGLTPRVGVRSQTRNPVYSPEPEPLAKLLVRQAEEPRPAQNLSLHVQKISSTSQSPAKSRKKEVRPSTNYPASSSDNLAELLCERDLTKKFLLIRQTRLQAQPKTRAEVPRTPPTTTPLPSRIKPKKKEERKRYQLPPEAAIRPKPLPPRKEERVSAKEAMRDKEWLSKAREPIISGFQALIQQSFGVTITAPTEPCCYKYFVGKGNNAQLVKTMLGNRWWWTRVEEEDKAQANLVWTQWKEMEWMSQMEAVAEQPTAAAAGETAIQCAVRYNPSTGPYKQSLQGRAVDLTPLGYDLIFKSLSFAKVTGALALTPVLIKTHNKLESNHHLSNKKALFINMKQYYECLEQDPFTNIPFTFHIKEGEADPEFANFEERYREIAEEAEQEDDPAKKQRNVWILKPGENTNRGTGITVCNTIEQIKEEMKTAPADEKTGVKRTFILQRYLDRPFLINRRKFDIRLYALITCSGGVLQAYYYNEGYIRTSSKEFNINNVTNKLIHLTNDAVQKYSEDYGKFEMANKLSYSDLQRYLDAHYKEKNINFLQDVAPQLKALVKDTVQATYLKLDPKHRAYSFEIFGYDFMLDEALKPWLIEVNTNPCLELSSPLLARVIPSMLDNAFR